MSEKPPEPTEDEKRFIEFIAGAPTMGLAKARHKKTGEWHTLLIVTGGTGEHVFPVARLFSPTCDELDAYEPPEGCADYDARTGRLGPLQ